MIYDDSVYGEDFYFDDEQDVLNYLLFQTDISPMEIMAGNFDKIFNNKTVTELENYLVVYRRREKLNKLG
jgi:hypothetical protein